MRQYTKRIHSFFCLMNRYISLPQETFQFSPLRVCWVRDVILVVESLGKFLLLERGLERVPPVKAAERESRWGKRSSRWKGNRMRNWFCFFFFFLQPIEINYRHERELVFIEIGGGRQNVHRETFGSVKIAVDICICAKSNRGVRNSQVITTLNTIWSDRFPAI